MFHVKHQNDARGDEILTHADRLVRTGAVTRFTHGVKHVGGRSIKVILRVILAVGGLVCLLALIVLVAKYGE